MNFILKNIPVIKSNNTINKTNIFILISILPLLIYKTIITNFSMLFMYLISIFINTIIMIIIDFAFSKKAYKFDIKKYIQLINILLINYLFVIQSSSIIIIFIINQVLLIINKFINNIKISLNISSIFLIILLFMNEPIRIKYNLYILISLLTISFIYLIITGNVKFRITISFLLIILFSLIFKNTNIQIPLILSLYILPDLKSTSIYIIVQYAYGLLLGIIYLLFGINILLISVIIFSILIKYIDLYYSYIISKRH